MSWTNTTQSASERRLLRGANRGQILLVTTISVILIMFTMALAINTAGITELERSDGVEYQQQEVSEHLSTTVYAVEQAVEHANHDTTVTDNTARQTRLTSSGGDIDTIDERLSHQFGVERGQITMTTDSVNSDGIRLWSPLNTSFTVNEGGQQQPRTDYVIYNGVDATRAFAIELSGSNLTSSPTDAFTVDVSTDASSLSYSIYESDSSTNEVTIEDGSGTTCVTQGVRPDSPVSISFSDATVNGDYCEILPETESITRVQIQNGDNADGALSVIVEADQSNIEYLDDDPNRTVRDSPTDDPSQLQAHTAIYSVTLAVTVSSPTADITTTVRITPGLYPTAETRYE